MRIRDVRTIALEYALDRPVFDANYIMATKPALLVEVETDEGLVGLGEAAHFGGPLASTRTVIEGELREHLVGEDPRDIERLWEQMHQRAYKHARGGIVIAAMSGIDIALWDLRGKMAGMPLWRLLGGYRRRVPAYATGGFYAEGKGIRELVAEMEAYCRHGFRAVKMKVGRNSDIEGSPLRAMAHRGVCEVSLAEDLARVRAVREAIGPDVRLMVDVNGAWDVPTAVKMGRAMEPLDVYWYEEPVCPDDLRGSAEVARESRHTGRGLRDVHLRPDRFPGLHRGQGGPLRPARRGVGRRLDGVPEDRPHGAGVEPAAGAAHPWLGRGRGGGRAPPGGRPERQHGGDGLSGASLDGGIGQRAAPRRSNRVHRAQRATRPRH